MNELISSKQEPTMSSVEIADLTGKQHKDVMADIRNMCKQLDIQSADFSADYTDSRGRSQPCFKLDRYHTEVLVTGYDVRRRAAVIKRWYDLETGKAQPVATVKDPQLAAMVTMLTKLDAVKQEQEAQRLELAELRAKVTATPDEYYTVAGYASLRGISLDTKRANLLGRKAAKVSREHGVDIGKAHSSIYGEVNTYHVDVLCEIFE